MAVSRSAGGRAGLLTVWELACLPLWGRTGQIGGLMAAEIRMIDWRGRRCHRRHQSRSLHGRGREVNRMGVAPVMYGPVDDPGEEPFCL